MLSFHAMYIFSTLENVEFSRVEEKHNESGMRNPGGLKTSRFHAMYIFSTLENVEFSRDVYFFYPRKRRGFEGRGKAQRKWDAQPRGAENVEFSRDVYFFYPRKR